MQTLFNPDCAISVTFTRTSILSGEKRSMAFSVTPEQLMAFYSGVYVQDAFPHLSPDDREFILNGIIPDEWNEIAGDEE